MDDLEIDPAVRARYPSYCWDHARDGCPFEDPDVPIYRMSKLDAAGEPGPVRLYGDPLADRRWLFSTADQVTLMMADVTSRAIRVDRSPSVVDFFWLYEAGGMRIESIRGDGAVLRTGVTAPTSALPAEQPPR